MTTNYHLVYQCGIANVFRCSKAESEGSSIRYERLLQGDYRTAETFCRGLLETGAAVSVWHSDVAGDVLLCPCGPWQEGPGGLWREKKFPPRTAKYADVA